MKSSYSIIKNVILTEKSSRAMQEEGKYVFHVDSNANRIDIRKAVEELYNVKVTGVNTLTRKGKRKRERSMHYGVTSDVKRAVVTLKKGDSIEVI